MIMTRQQGQKILKHTLIMVRYASRIEPPALLQCVAGYVSSMASATRYTSRPVEALAAGGAAARSLGDVLAALLPPLCQQGAGGAGPERSAPQEGGGDGATGAVTAQTGQVLISVPVVSAHVYSRSWLPGRLGPILPSLSQQFIYVWALDKQVC